MKDFRNLKVWEKSHQLTLDIYKSTEKFPNHEKYGITSQLRRASVSVPANIAEGSGRRSDGEFGRFLGIAMGSASEVEYLIILATDLGLVDGLESAKLTSGIIEVKRMLASLIIKIKADR